jgi:hypothetical protein
MSIIYQVKDKFRNILQNTVTAFPEAQALGRVCSITLILGLSSFSYSASLSHFSAKGSIAVSSYLLAQSDQYIARVAASNRVNSFTIKNGIIVKASSEIVLNGRRVAADFVLVGNKYQVTKILRTNQFLYNSESVSDLYIDEKCSLKGSKLEDIAKVISSTDYASRYLDNSCSNLPKLHQMSLLKTRNYFNPTDESYINLQKCLKGIYTNPTTKDEKLKSAVLNIQAGLVATAEREERTPTFKIYCEENKDSSAKKTAVTEPSIGKIKFFTRSDGLTVDRENIAKTFIHEIVHYTRQSTLSKDQEEDLAAYVAESCTGNSMAKVPDFSVDKDTGIIGMTNSKKTTASEVAPQATLEIRKTVDAIPVQQIPLEDLNTVSTIADNAPNSPKGTGHASNAYESVLSSASNNFSTALKVIDKSIPVANATAGENLANSFNISNKTRVPASESLPKSRGPTSENPGSAASGERLVEEILVNSKDGKKLIRTVVEHTDDASAELSGSTGIGTSQSTSARASFSNSGDNFSQNLASASAAQSRGNPSRVIASVGGVEFNAGLVGGQAYRRYTTQISSPSFRSQLENAGILISKQGKLITRPKKMIASYFDDGKSLVYGDF